jgi:hypothetical protein
MEKGFYRGLHSPSSMGQRLEDRLEQFIPEPSEVQVSKARVFGQVAADAYQSIRVATQHYVIPIVNWLTAPLQLVSTIRRMKTPRNENTPDGTLQATYDSYLAELIHIAAPSVIHFLGVAAECTKANSDAPAGVYGKAFLISNAVNGAFEAGRWALNRYGEHRNRIIEQELDEYRTLTKLAWTPNETYDVQPPAEQVRSSTLEDI